MEIVSNVIVIISDRVYRIYKTHELIIHFFHLFNIKCTLV